MRRFSLLLATAWLTLGFASPTASSPNKTSINDRIVTFCKKAVGTKVGDGQCADLAYQAILAAGAESPDDFKDDPKPGDYVWGKFLYEHKVDGDETLEKGDRAAVQPGDIVQMRDVIIEHEEQTREYITKETIDADHHTAIVTSVSPDGLTYDVIEQNANDEPTVTVGKLHLEDMKQGYILVYRAITDDTPDDDPATDSRLQGQSATNNHRTHRTIAPRRPRNTHPSKHAHRTTTRHSKRTRKA